MALAPAVDDSRSDVLEEELDAEEELERELEQEANTATGHGGWSDLDDVLRVSVW